MKINEAVRGERLAHRNALIQHLKTVVVAQDRSACPSPASLTHLHDSTGLNKALLSVDIAAEEAIDRNIEQRYDEKIRTAYNTESRRLQDLAKRADSADLLKHTLRASSQRAHELVQEEKSQRFNALNPLSEDLCTESRTLSTCTSSKVSPKR
jgi:hypothetical protein